MIQKALDVNRSIIPLTAYLASALTGLPERERSEITALQSSIEKVCSDNAVELYRPELHSDPLKHKDLLPPEVWYQDHDTVLSSDLLILITKQPSFGAGQELEFARNALLPIIMIIPKGRDVSRMVRGSPGTVITVEYDSREDLIISLSREIRLLRPLLVERKLAFGKSDEVIIGAKIRELRVKNGMTREDLAKALRISAEEIRSYEEKPDRISNPSLLTLRKLATVLRVSVADLSEPDYLDKVDEQVVHMLEGRDVVIAGGRKVEELPANDRRRIRIRIINRHLEEIGKQLGEMEHEG